MTLLIRNETPEDYREVEELNREAFWNLYRPGCDEHYLVHTMRSHADFLPELAFVAVDNGRIIGNIMYTKSYVVDENGNKMDTLSFGPLCVHPSYQRKGVGKALIEHTKKIAIERGIPAILIYGSIHNYAVNGFKSGKDYNVASPDGKFHFGLLVLELREGTFAGHQWKLFESDAFEFDQKDVEEFDKTFKPKEKGFRYTQVEFGMEIRAVIE